MNEALPDQNFLELMTLLKGGGSTNIFPVHPFNRPGSRRKADRWQPVPALQSHRYTHGTANRRNILFIEDISEYFYHLDRMMQSLKLSGRLKNLKALLVGDFTEMKENDTPFGQTTEEIILDAVSEYSYPVCFGFPAGHARTNLPLMLGADYSLAVNENQASLSMIS
jgi:muramoyltetrapeptide carboxypeptidase